MLHNYVTLHFWFLQMRQMYIHNPFIKVKLKWRQMKVAAHLVDKQLALMVDHGLLLHERNFEELGMLSWFAFESRTYVWAILALCLYILIYIDKYFIRFELPILNWMVPLYIYQF